MKFKNRSEAGRILARELKAYKGQDVIVLAIPMGGVPVGYEVAREYNAPLDLIMSKKIGAPFNQELAVGAVTWNGAVLLDQDMMDRWQISRDYIDGEAHRISAELKSRLDGLRAGLGGFQKLYGRTVFIVDDGIATGATMIAAVEAVRDQGPKDVVIATPVLPAELVESLNHVATLVYAQAPEDFEAVGQYYEQFETLEDDQVKEYILLANTA
ncbi:MAG TPA: phosphoribosyltransferase family protein [Methanocellaceae archaeon]|jgi:putative phosphoribosyl transferase